MKYLAWGVIALYILSLGANCYFIGQHKEKKPYSGTDIISLLISASIIMPLVGRILNWW